MTRHRTLPFVLILGVVYISAWRDARAQDFPQWRGTNRDGVILDFAVPEVWPDELTRVWSVPVGAGLSSPIIVGDRIFLFTRSGEAEVLSAFDLADGSVLWRQNIEAPFTPNPMAATFAFPVSRGSGPFATPAYRNGRIYTLGVTRVLSSFDADSGRPLWRNVLYETPEGGEIYYECPICFMECDGVKYSEGGICPEEGCGSELFPIRTGMDTAQRHTAGNYYGAASSPLVENDIGIVHVGDHERGWVVAFDPETGMEKWRWQSGPAIGASPIIAEIDGERQVIALGRGEVAGVSLSGELLWKQDHVFNSYLVTPIVHENRVILGPYRGSIYALEIRRSEDRWTAQQVWRSNLTTWVSSPVLFDGRLYGLAYNKRGQYFCLSADTGETIWTSQGRIAAYASVLHLGPVFISLTDFGALQVIDASERSYELVAQYKVADSIDEASEIAVSHFGEGMEVAETWAHPALSGDSIVIKGADFLARWRVHR